MEARSRHLGQSEVEVVGHPVAVARVPVVPAVVHDGLHQILEHLDEQREPLVDLPDVEVAGEFADGLYEGGEATTRLRLIPARRPHANCRRPFFNEIDASATSLNGWKTFGVRQLLDLSDLQVGRLRVAWTVNGCRR